MCERRCIHLHIQQNTILRLRGQLVKSCELWVVYGEWWFIYGFYNSKRKITENLVERHSLLINLPFSIHSITFQDFSFVILNIYSQLAGQPKRVSKNSGL